MNQRTAGPGCSFRSAQTEKAGLPAPADSGSEVHSCSSNHPLKPKRWRSELRISAVGPVIGAPDDNFPADETLNPEDLMTVLVPALLLTDRFVLRLKVYLDSQSFRSKTGQKLL